MAKASRKEMEELHGVLAKVIRDELLKVRIDEDSGEAMPPNAAILGIARQFLKDNGIESIVEKSDPLAGLKDAALPFASNVVDKRNWG